jgi:hypothetical protein
LRGIARHRGRHHQGVVALIGVLDVLFEELLGGGAGRKGHGGEGAGSGPRFPAGLKRGEGRGRAAVISVRGLEVERVSASPSCE